MDNTIQDSKKGTWELDFIGSALNYYWHNANYNLQRKDLGDIERKNYDYSRDRAKELMQQISDKTFYLISENEALKEQCREMAACLGDYKNLLESEIKRNGDSLYTDEYLKPDLETVTNLLSKYNKQ